MGEKFFLACILRSFSVYSHSGFGMKFGIFSTPSSVFAKTISRSCGS